MNGQAESASISLGECFACGDQPEFFFPQWDSIVESENGAGSVETEYRIRLTTPCSCSQCAEE